jgi:hypothetical protein
MMTCRPFVAETGIDDSPNSATMSGVFLKQKWLLYLRAIAGYHVAEMEGIISSS